MKLVKYNCYTLVIKNISIHENLDNITDINRSMQPRRNVALKEMKDNEDMNPGYQLLDCAHESDSKLQSIYRSLTLTYNCTNQ